jgi:formamidopyrimidine-DNA glycosylase
MPELPEVETVRRGISPALLGKRLLGARVREHRLRWPVDADLDERLRGRHVLEVTRRGKYLLIRLDRGALILHLGMSGSLRFVPEGTPAAKHDHVDIVVEDGVLLRLRDPRRFGALLFTDDPESHALIRNLGVEPLEPDFDGALLYALTRDRSSAIKPLIMNATLVVGVGNIYANEALYHASIHPDTAAGRLSRKRCDALAEAIKITLRRAVEKGGSTLRDFVDSRGKPGYFQQTYVVYGRTGEPCRACGTPIKEIRHGNRATFFCPKCQKR